MIMPVSNLSEWIIIFDFDVPIGTFNMNHIVNKRKLNLTA